MSSSQASEVYKSTGSDGQVRWATQPLDASYQKVPALSTPALVAAQPGKLAKTGVHGKGALQARRNLQVLRAQWEGVVTQVAQRHGVDATLVLALIEVESGFNPRAVSPKGARGLMQLMPQTAARYGVADARQLLDPQTNLEAGVRHLKDLLLAHQDNVALALASYNAGQGAVNKYGQRIPRYNETMLYVPAVLAAAASNTVTGTTAGSTVTYSGTGTVRTISTASTTE